LLLPVSVRQVSSLPAWSSQRALSPVLLRRLRLKPQRLY
jgi:hypothetical protein